MLSIIIPTFNERDNLPVLFKRLTTLLSDIPFEILVVDDHSPDGTADFVRKCGRENLRIRVLERRGRRGLASACVEGALASCGEVIAVMDADLQHDESLLIPMWKLIISREWDGVVGSRFIGESVHSLSPLREKISRNGIKIANYFLPSPLTDPMSGFFMVRREIFTAALPRMSPMGFKILFDLLASYPHQGVRIQELSFHFRPRFHGESKLDSLVIWEFAMYLAERLTRGKFSAHFISFALIGSLGVLFHLSIIKLLLLLGMVFIHAHIVATSVTIILNFILNNFLTYRHKRLAGIFEFLKGLLSFYGVCAVGFVGNVGVAHFMVKSVNSPWAFSAVMGIVVGTFWNYGISKQVTWKN